MNRQKHNSGWIVALLGALCCLVMLVMLMAVGQTGELEQVVINTSLTEQILNQIKAILAEILVILNDYGWILAAVFISPLITFRGVQYAKHVGKAMDHPLNRYVMDIVSILMVWCLSYLFLSQDGGIQQVLIIAGIIAALHTCIIKIIFNSAPEKVAEVLADGMYVDEKTSFGKRTVAALVGTRGDKRMFTRDDKQ